MPRHPTADHGACVACPPSSSRSFLAVALAPSAHAAPHLPPPGKVFSGAAAGTSLGSFARETGDHPVYNQGALTNGPFRLRRYPRSRAALRRALDHRRFALR